MKRIGRGGTIAASVVGLLVLVGALVIVRD